MNNIKVSLSHLANLTAIKRNQLVFRTRERIDDENIKHKQAIQISLNISQVRTILEENLNVKKSKIIYIGNLKGGVGKTALAYLLINSLSALGVKVCAIDLDVQANLTGQFIPIPFDKAVFSDLINGTASIESIINNVHDRLDIIPSSLKNGLIPKYLSLQSPKHYLTWFNELCLDYLRDKYEVIIVDTPPSLSTINSVFCLCLNENDNIVIPAGADEFSLVGIGMFLDDTKEIRKAYSVKSNPKISILINKFFQNQKTNLDMLVKIGNEYNNFLSPFIVKECAKIKEIVNKKLFLNKIQNDKEIHMLMSNLLKEIDILK